MVRVVVVDRSPEVRRQVGAALVERAGFKVVGEAGSGAEGVAQVAAVRPDVAVIDVGLPDLAGREVLTRMRVDSPQTRVVVFSGPDVPDRAWLERHSAGYALKDTQLDYLVQLVGSVLTPRTTAPILQLSDEPSRIAEARRFVRQQLTAWGHEELIDDASLVVTELATNAIAHARTPYLIRVSAGLTSVRIEVIDQGAGSPEPHPPTDDAEGGRGLLIVSSLAASWGIEDALPGKVVWADLLLPR